MKKYLARLCKAIREDRFNDENYRNEGYWYGHKIQTRPLSCSYGTIGFTVSVFGDNGSHFCDVDCDLDLGEITINDKHWKEYINLLYLEDNDITCNSCDELECYTDAGEDMFITLDKIRKKNLQEYIDNFDIDYNVSIWWENGKPGEGVPFDNMKEHYEDYEAYLKRLQKICNKMPF